MLKQLALAIPPIRRLWNDRLSLIEQRDQAARDRDSMAAQRDRLAKEVAGLTQPHTATDLFNIAYGRAPTEQELTAIAAPSDVPTATDLRALIASADRQTYPSPVSVRFSPQDLRLAEFEGVKLWLDRMDRAVSAPVLAGWAYEPHMVSFLREHVRKGMTVVDIGANVGIFTMLAASLGAEVHAVEPNTENCRLILLSKEENGFHNVKLYPLAVSNETGALFFTPHIGSNGGILPNRSETLSDPNCIVVPAMRLDDLVNGPVHFIKADVEGAEYLALKGAERIIRENKPIITIELSMEMVRRVSGIDGIEFIRWLQSFGYRALLIGRNGERNDIDDLDVFARKWGEDTRIEDVAFLPTK